MKEEKLKKIIIISYFFPPCNLTAAQRASSWARYLHRFGYYPVVITRNWEHHISTPDDMHHASGSEMIHEKQDGYEIYYVPFKGNLRDRIYARYGKNKFNFLRKLLSFIELLSHHFVNKMIPFHEMHSFADELLKKDKEFKALVVTGNPFEIFRFGYLLHLKYQIPWIADYRDDWNTSDVNESRGRADALLRNLEKRSEKKYMATASLITSVSPHYVQKISSFVHRPGEVLLNGFFEDDYRGFENIPLNQDFTIIYNGMLYPSQQIEVFLQAFKKLIDSNPEHKKVIKLKFPGIMFLKDQAQRVKNLMKGYEDHMELMERLPREEVINMQAGAHLLLMISHKNAKGIPSSKIYEYLALGKPVMICPGDKDILEETFEPYNLGYVAQHEEQAYQQLHYLFRIYLKNEYEFLKPDLQYTRQFSRIRQTEKLAQLLGRII